VDKGKTKFEYTIDTEFSIGNLKFLPEYIQRYYLIRHGKYREFRNTRIVSENGKNYISYHVLVPKTDQYVGITVDVSIPIEVTMELSDPSIPKSFLDQLYEDLFLIVQLFEEEIRKTTLYLAFLPGEKIVPEKERAGMSTRIFTDSMLPLFLLLISLTFVFFWIVGGYAPLIFVVLSFTLVLFSGKLIARGANWKITEDQPEIYLLQYHLMPDKFNEFRKRYTGRIPEIRKEIYDASFAAGKPIDCETAGKVFTKYGIDCESKDFTIKKVNLYNWGWQEIRIDILYLFGFLILFLTVSTLVLKREIK